MGAGFNGTIKNNSVNLANDKLWSFEGKSKKNSPEDQDEKLGNILARYENKTENHSKYLAC